MRITFNMLSNQSLLNINDGDQQIEQLSQQIGSGQKMSSAADNPEAWAQAMNVQHGLTQYNSVVSNINFATGWNQATSSALNSISNLVSQAKQIAISAGSPTGTSDSSGLATQLGGVLQQVINLANTQYGDQYVFAGSATGSAPYSIDNTTGVVSNSGNTNPINVRTGISDGTSDNITTVNVTGDSVFNYTTGGNSANLINQIWQLQQDITNGNSAGISSDLTSMDDAFNNVNNQSSVVGEHLDELNSQQSAISVAQTNQQGVLSSLQDTDLAQATTQLTQAQTAFQAALKVSGSLSNLNLSYYLGTTL